MNDDLFGIDVSRLVEFENRTSVVKDISHDISKNNDGVKVNRESNIVKESVEQQKPKEPSKRSFSKNNSVDKNKRKYESTKQQEDDGYGK